MTELRIRERPSPNHAERTEPARIDALVLHYTGMPSAAAALERLCDPAAKVSAHYLVEENGAIWRLVPESRRAFHAGRSFWSGESDLNAVSIGIEIVNPGHEWGYRPYPPAQMAAVEDLCRAVLARHSIPCDRVLGHSDIAPDRKSDPGELFDWPRLARAGIGIWPQPPPGTAEGRGREVGGRERTAALADLAAIGYFVERGEEETALAAFQRRFRPARWDGRLDAESAIRLAQVRAAFAQARSRTPSLESPPRLLPPT
jgi:N-acetylmuramoyl-L-alanine amidase